MRLIDADALMKCIPSEEITSRMAVANAPTIEERKTGRWRKMLMACYGGGTLTEYECSECEEHQVITSDYCPNCGSDMRGGNERQ